MDIEVRWHDATRTLLNITVPPHWTWLDLDEAMKKSHNMMATVDHPVHSIYDFRQCQYLPSEPSLNGQSGQWIWQSNAGQAFFVASSLLLHRLIAVLSKSYPQMNQKTLLVNTMSEARLYLADLGCVMA